MSQHYYSTLEKKSKQALIDQIVIVTQRHSSTVASWYNDKRNPCLLEKQAIADILGIDRNKLFPVASPTFKPKKD